ncbi:hypothetical protein QBZ16_004060 [Prototheca wickerhamii]|uniref:Sfi1 spindle body domain-containing protein n=1 Tax=Prototheca wickerhamii TaxID=3111 RepID=A0AAD9ILJ0_PROWI|nr:hypothetical protein QBZ16_004060 [Prototheca wickerhamii]
MDSNLPPPSVSRKQAAALRPLTERLLLRRAFAQLRLASRLARLRGAIARRCALAGAACDLRASFGAWRQLATPDPETRARYEEAAGKLSALHAAHSLRTCFGAWREAAAERAWHRACAEQALARRAARLRAAVWARWKLLVLVQRTQALEQLLTQRWERRRLLAGWFTGWREAARALARLLAEGRAAEAAFWQEHRAVLREWWADAFEDDCSDAGHVGTEPDTAMDDDDRVASFAQYGEDAETSQAIALPSNQTTIGEQSDEEASDHKTLTLTDRMGATACADRLWARRTVLATLRAWRRQARAERATAGLVDRYCSAVRAQAVFAAWRAGVRLERQAVDDFAAARAASRAPALGHGAAAEEGALRRASAPLAAAALRRSFGAWRDIAAWSAHTRALADAFCEQRARRMAGLVFEDWRAVARGRAVLRRAAPSPAQRLAADFEGLSEAFSRWRRFAALRRERRAAEAAACAADAFRY